MLNNPLANALSKILNSERLGKGSCTVSPVSKGIKKILEIMHHHKYLGSVENVTEAKGGILAVPLLGRINKCGVITPRFPVKLHDYEKYEKRYLPASNMGIIIISTSKGVMTHQEAKKKQIGGKLMAYCY